MCPDCREQRRLAHINQLNLFSRTCSDTGKRLVTHFPPEAPLKVCTQEHWYSDAVDNTAAGVPYDPNRLFFDQWDELSRRVTYPALMTDYLHNENSEYTNYAGRLKDCYLLFDSDESRDCYYGYTINNCRSSVDCYRVKQLELCYEVVDSRSCYNSSYLENCENCFDAMFLSNCIGCRNCIGCSNLRHKEFHILNKPVSKAEFAEFRKKLTDRRELDSFKRSFALFKMRYPQKALRGFQNENVSGNYLVNCKNVHRSFDCLDLWDGRYAYQMFMRCKDCFDTDECGEGELLYECSNLGYNAYQIRCSMNSLNQLTNLDYCDSCFNGCSDLFGCIGLKRKQFCILNVQYSEAEFRELSATIKANMIADGEWGEFFPATISKFPYNLTLAQLFYPLTEAEALAKGFTWNTPSPREFQPQTVTLPPTIAEAPDTLLQAVLGCKECRKNYKIIAAELEFYRGQGIPLPEYCFDCRHRARLAQRMPRKLFERSCGKCAAGIETSYSPDRPELVYCEKCYLEALE